MIKKEIALYEETANLLSEPKVPMFFRQMVGADAPEVHAIETDVFPSPWSEMGIVNTVAQGYNCWVLCEEESRKIAGYFMLMTSIDEAHLLKIALKSSLHGKGYGRMLMDRVLQTAREHGMVSMLLEVLPSNTGPYNMYVKYGFEQIGIRKNYYINPDGTREDAIVMRKML